MQIYNTFFKNQLLLLFANLHPSQNIVLSLHYMNRHKKTGGVRRVSVSVLEMRMERAIRPKDRLWAMIRLAEELGSKESTQTERALMLFADAEHLAEEIHDRRGLASAIRGMGNSQLRLYHLAAALETLARALPIAEQTSDVECEIQILQDIGSIHRRLSQHDQALKTLQKCAELAELIGNGTAQASALNQMGAMLTDIGQYHKAIEYHTKSLGLLDRADIPSTSRITSTEHGRHRGPGRRRIQAITLMYLSTAFRHLGRYAEALSTLGRASRLSHAERDSHNEGFCRGNMGVIYFAIGDYPNALASFIAAAKIMERIGDKLNLANSYANLTQLYLQLGNPEQAKDFGEKALATFEEIGDKRGLAAMFGVISDYYIGRGEKTRATQMLRRCLALSREIGAKDYESEALTTLANLEVSFGKFSAARKHFQRALSIANKSGDRDRIIAALLGLGTLSCKQAQPNRALSLLEGAVTIAEEIHSPRHEYEAHRTLSEALESIGEFKRSITHWKHAFHIKEKILSVEKQKTIAEVQMRSNIEKAKIENALLRKEMESKSREIERMALRLAEKTELIRSVSHQLRKILTGYRVSGIGYRVSEKRDSSYTQNPIPEFDKLLLEIEGNHRDGNKKIMFHNEFQIIHRHVLQKLSKHYPTLTFTERKICVLLNEGLSTKQMADMLKASPRAIEKYRYEIRKKMKLGRTMNLSTVMAGIV